MIGPANMDGRHYRNAPFCRQENPGNRFASIKLTLAMEVSQYMKCCTNRANSSTMGSESKCESPKQTMASSVLTRRKASVDTRITATLIKQIKRIIATG